MSEAQPLQATHSIALPDRTVGFLRQNAGHSGQKAPPLSASDSVIAKRQIPVQVEQPQCCNPTRSTGHPRF